MVGLIEEALNNNIILILYKRFESKCLLQQTDKKRLSMKLKKTE